MVFCYGWAASVERVGLGRVQVIGRGDHWCQGGKEVAPGQAASNTEFGRLHAEGAFGVRGTLKPLGHFGRGMQASTEPGSGGDRGHIHALAAGSGAEGIREGGRG